ncbi:hypothetical protein [Sphingomonas baiyangensis]|uniref:Uncharacterized protein n=1 Tax=Sphingomonas baiyangensis TaxID=2572576 RepID=A0A4U1L4I3_9SPHN|nr:hypothetical protein [Sphingomonas baiyangensis]TKD51095.1 hypothetical protein FBR43_10240 [Sphingomonas baiyangensis]
MLPALYLLAGLLYFTNIGATGTLPAAGASVAIGIFGSIIAAPLAAIPVAFLAWPATRFSDDPFAFFVWRADRPLVSIAATFVYGGLAAFALADALNAALALPAIESLWSLFSVPTAFWLLLCRAAVIDRSPNASA